MPTAKSKYIGKTFDGYWTVVDCIPKGGGVYSYVLRNDFNNRELIVNGKTMMRIASGESRVSTIIQKRYLGRSKCFRPLYGFKQQRRD